MYCSVIVDIAHKNLDRVFDYYVPRGMELCVGARVRAPFGNASADGIALSLSETTNCPPEKVRPLLAVLSEKPVVTEEQLKLAEGIRAYYHTTLAFALRLMMPAEVRRERVFEKTCAYIVKKDESLLKQALASCYTKNGVLKAKNRHYAVEQLLCGEPVPRAILDGSAIKYLIDTGAAEQLMLAERRNPYSDIESCEDKRVCLNDAQRAAVDAITGDVSTGAKSTFLLHGVTGSGKTEVYMAAVEACIAMGKTAIVLVPEIALAPQLYGQFLRRFGDRTAIFHSGLSAGERYDEWKRVLEGGADIVLGARSAVFAPLNSLGLIIIDEEHESSYRADNHPCYSAGEIAEMRRRTSGATIVLGSATPKIETYFRAKTGAYKLLGLPERVSGLPMPEISVVDMRREMAAGNRSVISGELYAAIKRVLMEGKQALLFLNRRGYSNFVMCRACGYTMMCTHCDIPVKYHDASKKLICHSCGRSWDYSNVCPECRQPYLKKYGVGTEQVEETVKRLFPAARTLRMDYDTTRKKNAHARIYDAFARGDADILIGTQMIAKGLDFPNVLLSAIISADAMLNMGEYNAAERAYTMIEQVAGRAGRKEPGNVIIQTYEPDNYAITFAATHDYEGFFMAELRHRKQALLPPYATIYRILISHEDADRCRIACDMLKKALADALLTFRDDIKMFVCGEAPVSKLQGSARYHIMFKAVSGKTARAVKNAVFAVTAEFDYKNVVVSVELDPLSTQ